MQGGNFFVTTLLIIFFVTTAIIFASCGKTSSQTVMPQGIVQKNSVAAGQAEIYLAGGCFWGTEMYLSLLDGVEATEVGYANGYSENPTYRAVCNDSGHAETVHVVYNPEKISLRELLDEFFKTINPVSKNRQGNDRGVQYRTGIYFSDESDAEIIETALQNLQTKYKEPLAVESGAIVNFYRAEEEHQKYLTKNLNGYCHIPNYLFDELHKKNRHAAENHARGKIYDKPNQDELKKILTQLQYAVTQEAATEPPYQNAYDKEFREGIYCDITTGQPLFVSTAKFESGCGWPAFSRPIDESVLIEREDKSFGMTRTEVIAKASGAHLGHVFDDGSKKFGGLRYCINSASLRFVPKEKMSAEGYGDYLDIFDEE